MSDPTTSRESPKFLLRLPDGMRDRIAAEARVNGRSMNAEIVARLNSSFNDQDANLPSARPAEPPAPENTVYILLDTNGMPISWNEIMTHLSEISKASKYKYSSQHARILVSDQVSSSGREEDDMLLFLKYRELNKDRLSKAARNFLDQHSTQHNLNANQEHPQQDTAAYSKGRNLDL